MFSRKIAWNASIGVCRSTSQREGVPPALLFAVPRWAWSIPQTHRYHISSFLTWRALVAAKKKSPQNATFSQQAQLFVRKNKKTFFFDCKPSLIFVKRQQIKKTLLYRRLPFYKPERGAPSCSTVCRASMGMEFTPDAQVSQKLVLNLGESFGKNEGNK